MIFVTHQNDTRQMMDSCVSSATVQMSFIRANGHMCPDGGSNLAVFTGNDKNIIGGFKMRQT